MYPSNGKLIAVKAVDIRLMNRYGKTPAVIFGPGVTKQWHAINEGAAGEIRAGPSKFRP